MSFLLNTLKAILFGIVQGIAEWFALGSDAHLRLMGSFMPLSMYGTALDNQIFNQMFQSVLCFGSVMAVLVMYVGRLNPFRQDIGPKEKRSVLRLWINIAVACIPALILWLFVHKTIGEKMQSSLFIGIVMVLTGVLLFGSQMLRKKKTVTGMKSVSVAHSAIAGLFNILSIFPGGDHTPALMTGCSLLGFSRTAAAEFAVFASIPGMFLGSMINIAALDLELNAATFGVLLIGLAASFFTSFAVIKKLMSYIKTHDLRIFGLYRVVLGVIVILAGLAGFAA